MARVPHWGAASVCTEYTTQNIIRRAKSTLRTYTLKKQAATSRTGEWIQVRSPAMVSRSVCRRVRARQMGRTAADTWRWVGCIYVENMKWQSHDSKQWNTSVCDVCVCVCVCVCQNGTCGNVGLYKEAIDPYIAFYRWNLKARGLNVCVLPRQNNNTWADIFIYIYRQVHGVWVTELQTRQTPTRTLTRIFHVPAYNARSTTCQSQ